MSKFKAMRFASLVVVLAIINVTIFTIIDILLLAFTNLEPTAIMPYFFGFWGGEMVLLAAKRIFVKENSKKETDGGNQ